MFDADLVKLLADRAVAFLDYDDDHPDVGMGMSYDTAIELAEKDVYKEAARWNSIEALKLDFPRYRDTVKANVILRRKKYR